MSDAEPKDTRSSEQIAAHAALAREEVRAERRRIAEALEAHPRLATPGAMASAYVERATHEYKILLEYNGGIFVAGIAVQFYTPDGATKLGTFSGLGVPSVEQRDWTAWGNATLNYKIDELRRWKVSFQANFMPLTVKIKWTGLMDEAVGSSVVGVLDLIGTIGGYGDF
jgi:hypothetical protein